MNDHIRTAEADRERVAERLREHYAQGRLSAEEFDERLTAALGATTFGDLRQTMTDLPEPGTGPGGSQSAAGPGARRGGGRPRRPRRPPWSGRPGWGPPGSGGPGWGGPGWAGARWAAAGWEGPRRRRPFRRGARILPLLLIALILALVIPGLGWLFITLIKVMLVLWLLAMVAGAVALFRFRRHTRRWKQAFFDQDWPGRDWYQHYRRQGNQFD
ncbi:MAG TPA: DUF1707 domain-containing protein [Streptosporangiaceae bacterium]|jgi:hypothetical protein